MEIPSHLTKSFEILSEKLKRDGIVYGEPIDYRHTDYSPTDPVEVCITLMQDMTNDQRCRVIAEALVLWGNPFIGEPKGVIHASQEEELNDD